MADDARQAQPLSKPVEKMETQYLTPQRAVNRGLWTIVVPTIAVLVAPVFVFVLLVKLHHLPATGPGGVSWALPAFLVSAVGSQLVWSIQGPRWRLWAYRRVEDIASLKRLAAERKMIGPEGSIFEWTEIASRRVRDELRQLEAAARTRRT